MDSHAISKLIGRADSFPPLPTVVSRVMEVTADPESSADDLLRVIIQDQSLVTMILKMSNSAFLGLPRRVDSLQQALAILGFTEIRKHGTHKGTL